MSEQSDIETIEHAFNAATTIEEKFTLVKRLMADIKTEVPDHESATVEMAEKMVLKAEEIWKQKTQG